MLNYSSFVDEDGRTWPTVGDNIRYGAKGASELYADVDIEFGANSGEPTIIDNKTGVSDLAANGQSQYINFTSASHNIVNVVGFKVLEADGAFQFGGVTTNSTGALALYIINSSAGVNARLRVYLKVDEY